MSFSGDEEKLIDSVVSVLDSGREKFTFQEVQLQSEIRYKDIIIDLNHREIIRDNKKIEPTQSLKFFSFLQKILGECFLRNRFMIWSGMNHMPVITIS